MVRSDAERLAVDAGVWPAMPTARPTSRSPFSPMSDAALEDEVVDRLSILTATREEETAKLGTCYVSSRIEAMAKEPAPKADLSLAHSPGLWVNL